TFGQAPVFTPDGRVVVGKDFRDGAGMQVYSSALDGSGRRCLTCELPAPNNVPAVRPQGDWILFHSWNGHHITFGSPGYGGSGFLYTETTGTAMDTELFFCRLTASGCQVSQLTNVPAWNEQAIFTPDMSSVIFMSSRDHPGLFNTFSVLTRDAGLTADADYLL